MSNPTTNGAGHSTDESRERPAVIPTGETPSCPDWCTDHLEVPDEAPADAISLHRSTVSAAPPFEVVTVEESGTYGPMVYSPAIRGRGGRIAEGYVTADQAREFARALNAAADLLDAIEAR